jgi:iron complex transport system substrate-binding protein
VFVHIFLRKFYDFEESMNYPSKFFRETKPLITLLAVALWFGLLISACQPATPVSTPTPAAVTLTDGLGRNVTLPGPAQRIVSLGPSNTEILFAIGAGPQVVGRDSFSDYPAEAQALNDVGGGFGELNTEAIVALKPDLVLVADIFPTEQIQALEALGLTVYALPNPNDFEGMFKNLETTARLTGHQADVSALLTNLRSRVAAVQEKIASATERPLVFYELDSTDPNAPYTAGPGTFIDTLIAAAGGVNLGSSLEGSWVQVSVEQLITQDPAIIVLGDYTWGGVTPEMVQARTGWEVLSAVKNGKVFTFDDNLVSRPGPRLVDGLENLAKLLHPDLFK